MTPNGIFNPETDCGADKKQGAGLCELRKGFGTDHPRTGNCKFHGGRTENGKKAAAREGAEQEAQRMVVASGVDKSPEQHLLESLHLAATLVQVWGSMVAELDDVAERENADAETRGELGYTPVDHDAEPKNPYELDVVSRDRLLALNRHGEAGVHPYVTEYQNALERRAKFAKLCIDAGVAKAQVRIAEAQGRMLAQAIRGILGELGVADKPEVPDVVRRHLAVVSGAA